MTFTVQQLKAMLEFTRKDDDRLKYLCVRESKLIATDCYHAFIVELSQDINDGLIYRNQIVKQIALMEENGVLSLEDYDLAEMFDDEAPTEPEDYPKLEKLFDDHKESVQLLGQIRFNAKYLNDCQNLAPDSNGLSWSFSEEYGPMLAKWDNWRFLVMPIKSNWSKNG
jgi:hypothetical protein